MIKERSKFKKKISDSSQMMLKLGRNIQWIEVDDVVSN